jgi:hypothetical protein
MNFAAAWSSSSLIEGWLTDGQARRLFDAAAQVPSDQAIVEIGSHHGRSTVLLARAKRPDVALVAVDPFEDDRWGGGQNALAVFMGNLQNAGVAADVTLLQKYGAEAGNNWHGKPVGMLFVDGAHDYPSVVADLRAWLPHVAPDGFLAMHDAFSSRGVTRAAFRVMFADREWLYCGSSRSLACFRRDRAHGTAATIRGSAMMLARLVWFARNLAIKTAMRNGWERVSLLLGHAEAGHPY